MISDKQLEEQNPCKHCGSETDECLWLEWHDGDEAPYGAQQLDEEDA